MPGRGWRLVSYGDVCKIGQRPDAYRQNCRMLWPETGNLKPFRGIPDACKQARQGKNRFCPPTIAVCGKNIAAKHNFLAIPPRWRREFVKVTCDLPPLCQTAGLCYRLCSRAWRHRFSTFLEVLVARFLDRLRKPSGAADVELPANTVSNAPPVELDPQGSNGQSTVFASETTAAPDALGLAPAINKLAQLAIHKNTQTPLSIGLFGGAGSGKSFALSHLLDDARALSSAAASSAKTPFVKQLAIARVDAGANPEPVTAIANAVFEALTKSTSEATGYAGWAESIAHRTGDPQQNVREESERASDMRRRQDSETQALEEIRSRRARLTENVLYDSAGTQIDSYARKNRAKIESRLTGFGFTKADPVATYKDLVREYAENGGILRRIRLFFHSLWAFDGQLKLIILAIVFAGLGWFLGQVETQPQWLTNFMLSMQERFSSLGSITDWVKSNAQHFTIAKNAAFVAAAGALLINVIRAVRFLGPIKRGARLLTADIETRRNDLDNLIKSQNQRIGEIGQEVETQSKRLEDAQLRADAARATPDAATQSPFGSATDDTHNRAKNFLASIASGLENGKDNGAPERIIVAIDNLDALSPAAANTWLQQSKTLIATPGITTLITANPNHLKAGLETASTGASLDEAIARIAQVPFRLDGKEDAAFGKLVKTMLGLESPDKQAALDASSSSLDDPMRPGEAELLANLADLAGSTPRQVKRYVNAYRVMRAGSTTFAPQIFALAVQSGALEQEKKQLNQMLGDLAEDASLDIPEASDSRIVFALRETAAAQVGPLTPGAIRGAMAEAALFAGRF